MRRGATLRLCRYIGGLSLVGSSFSSSLVHHSFPLARLLRRSLISLADTMLLPLSSAARTNRSATTCASRDLPLSSRSAFAAHPFPARVSLSSSSSTSRTVNKPSPDESTRRTNASTAASTSASPPRAPRTRPRCPPHLRPADRHRVGDESIPLKRVQRGIDIRRERHGVQTAVQRERELMQDVFPAVVAEQFVVRLLPRGDVAVVRRVPFRAVREMMRRERRVAPPTTQHAVQQTPDSVRRDHSK